MKKLGAIFTSKYAQLLLSLAVALSLAGLILLNLAWFYDKNPQERWTVFALTGGLLFGSVLLANHFIIAPIVKRIMSKDGLFFISLISMSLVAIFGLGAVYYWSVPVSHVVEICFDSADDTPLIEVQKLFSSLTNRVHSPYPFGAQRYPIQILSGTCVEGEIVTLFSYRSLWWEVPGLSIIVPATPPDGRFFVSINGSAAVVDFEANENEAFSNVIVYREGFENGKPFFSAQNLYFYLGIKGIGIVINALYLSFLLFGLSELVINNPDQDVNVKVINDVNIC